MKAPASHPTSFISKRNDPHRRPAFLLVLKHHNPTALHSPRQGFYLLLNVT